MRPSCLVLFICHDAMDNQPYLFQTIWRYYRSIYYYMQCVLIEKKRTRNCISIGFRFLFLFMLGVCSVREEWLLKMMVLLSTISVWGLPEEWPLKLLIIIYCLLLFLNLWQRSVSSCMYIEVWQRSDWCCRLYCPKLLFAVWQFVL